MTKTHTHSTADLSCAADFLDDIEVDESGKCEWAAVANAQTHIRAVLRCWSAAEPQTSADNVWSGMTLRDYFASKALPHALARERALIDRYGDKSAQDHVPNAAREAYRIADAMLKARSA